MPASSQLHTGIDTMTNFIPEPRATCPVIQGDPQDLEPWTTFIVSMMQAIQAGAELHATAFTVSWTPQPPTDVTMAISYLHGTTEFSLTSEPFLASGLQADDQARLLRSAINDFLMATIPDLDNLDPTSHFVTSGRRQEPSGSHHGYVTWAAPDSPAWPRIDISPDQIITLWQHWPETAPAPSTIVPHR